MAPLNAVALRSTTPTAKEHVGRAETRVVGAASTRASADAEIHASAQQEVGPLQCSDDLKNSRGVLTVSR